MFSEKQMIVLTFPPHSSQFRYSIRVLSDWALLTMGGQTEVTDSALRECVETTIHYLPLVCDLLHNGVAMSTENVKVGFVRLELINYVSALINSRNR
jgi:hypothetical protein